MCFQPGEVVEVNGESSGDDDRGDSDDSPDEKVEAVENDTAEPQSTPANVTTTWTTTTPGRTGGAATANPSQAAPLVAMQEPVAVVEL